MVPSWVLLVLALCCITLQAGHHTSASAPTNTPGMVALANQPKVATVALALDGNTIAAAGSPSAAATCLSASAPTNTPRRDSLENPPPALANANTTCAVGCSSDCSDRHIGSFVPAAILTATALPAVTNPSLTPPAIVAAATHGKQPLPAVIKTVVATAQGRWIGGAVNVAIGGPLAAGSATGVGGVAKAGGADPADRVRASIEKQRVCSHFVPHLCMQVKLCTEDLQLQQLTNADSQLFSVYKDTNHQNDGTHLDSGIGIAENAKWQRLYLQVATCHLLLYNLPNGQWANRFLETLMGLWIEVIEHCWNSEHPLVFQACILCWVRGIDPFSLRQAHHLGLAQCLGCKLEPGPYEGCQGGQPQRWWWWRWDTCTVG
jgi:hypothetical protein